MSTRTCEGEGCDVEADTADLIQTPGGDMECYRLKCLQHVRTANDETRQPEIKTIIHQAEAPPCRRTLPAVPKTTGQRRITMHIVSRHCQQTQPHTLAGEGEGGVLHEVQEETADSRLPEMRQMRRASQKICRCDQIKSRSSINPAEERLGHKAATRGPHGNNSPLRRKVHMLRGTGREVPHFRPHQQRRIQDEARKALQRELDGNVAQAEWIPNGHPNPLRQLQYGTTLERRSVPT